MENINSNDEIENLKKALYNTSSIYSLGQSKGALKEIILNGNEKYFTRKNNARADILEIGTENVRDIAIRRYAELIVSHPDTYNNPLEEAIRRTYLKYKQHLGRDEVAAVEGLVKNCLTEGADTSIFTRDDNAKEHLDMRLNIKGMKLSEFAAASIASRVTEDLILEILEQTVEGNESKVSNVQEDEANELQISNVQIHSENMQRAGAQIISGVGLKREGTISIGQELQACSSIGNIRKNQEDAVLLVTHPQNPEFKMMVVADGVGGMEAGEEASNILVTEMKKWFESLDISYYENVDELEVHLNNCLQNISAQISQRFGGRAGTTFVGAIVGKDKTLLSNVGDSRAYAVNGKNLQQITQDDSYVQSLYEFGIIQSRDHMRFHKNDNKITQCLGQTRIKPNSYILRNQDYDALMLFSDGVTDCLSDDQLFAITRNTDRTKLAESIVKSALRNVSIRPEGLDPEKYREAIYGGKDNTTAAVFIRGEQGQPSSSGQMDVGREEPSIPPPPASAGMSILQINKEPKEPQKDGEIELDM